jgi:hypothetical protein
MKTTQPYLVDGNPLSLRWRTLAALALSLAGLGWLLVGCVPTGVHPFYRETDVIQDPALLGVWKDKPDGKERWTFTPGEGNGYALEIQSDDQRAVLVAHLFKLGKERFLDLYPAKLALEEKLEKNPYSLALIPGHVFFRVLATGPTLRMSSMGLEWLGKELKQHPKAIEHVIMPEDRVVFTAGTEAMQAFIKQHLNDAEAWNEMYGDGLVRDGAKPAVK